MMQLYRSVWCQGFAHGEQPSRDTAWIDCIRLHCPFQVWLKYQVYLPDWWQIEHLSKQTPVTQSGFECQRYMFNYLHGCVLNTCYCTLWIILRSQIRTVVLLVYPCVYGLCYFAIPQDALDPNKGFIKDDSITLEVHVAAEAPHGVA